MDILPALTEAFRERIAAAKANKAASHEEASHG